ncbi:hypothetical protein DFH09DRAFT_1118980, partial [Mycena vulgaris]
SAILPAHDNPPNRPAPAETNPRGHTTSTSATIGVQAKLKTVKLATKLAALGALSKSLRGKCTTCWAFRGEFCIRSASHTCALGRGTDAAKYYLDYHNFLPKFDAVTACVYCGLPIAKQQSKCLFNVTDHPLRARGESDCTHPLALKEIAWVVYRTQGLYAKFMKDADHPFNPMTSTVEKYARWVAREDDGMMINAGNVAYWLIKSMGDKLCKTFFNNSRIDRLKISNFQHRGQLRPRLGVRDTTFVFKTWHVDSIQGLQPTAKESNYVKTYGKVIVLDD